MAAAPDDHMRNENNNEVNIPMLNELVGVLHDNDASKAMDLEDDESDFDA